MQNNMYPIQRYAQHLWETACSQINFPFFLMLCLECCNFLVNITVRLILGLMYKMVLFRIDHFQNFNSFFEER